MGTTCTWYLLEQLHEFDEQLQPFKIVNEDYLPLISNLTDGMMEASFI